MGIFRYIPGDIFFSAQSTRELVTRGLDYILLLLLLLHCCCCCCTCCCWLHLLLLHVLLHLQLLCPSSRDKHLCVQ